MMFSSHNRVGILKELEARSKEAATNQSDLATILERQAKMYQEFADFKKP